MKQKNKIHKDSEIWEYEGKIEFTKELVDFFEEERKRIKRENQSEFRHIAFEKIEDESVYSSIVNKQVTVSEQVEVNILLKQVYDVINGLTEVEKRRFTLNKVVGLKIAEIARLENVDASSVRESVNKAKNKINKIKK